MPQAKTGLSRKLLTRVLSVYFILTVIVTCGQILTEYLSTKNHIKGELQTLKNTFSTSLTRAIWELNIPQAISISEGLMALPIVEGIQIRDENGKMIREMGLTRPQSSEPITVGVMHDHPGGVFGYSFPLIFDFSGRASQVGDVTLYSSFGVIFGRIEVGIFFLIGNALIKTAFLVFLFLNAFRQMLTEPLSELSTQMSDFDAQDPASSKLHAVIRDRNELYQLQTSYNNLIDNLVDSQEKLKDAENELKIANHKLDEQNLVLEKEVAKKTASLSTIMLNLEQQKDELLAKQRQLRQENENRLYIEDELRKRNVELAESVKSQQETNAQLLELERIAALGGLVTGVTDTLQKRLNSNTEQTAKLSELLDGLDKQASPDVLAEMRDIISAIEENYRINGFVVNNLRDATIEQTTTNKRTIVVKPHLIQVLQTLAKPLNAGAHEVNLACPDDLEIVCMPGALAQVISGLVHNSIQHGFADRDHGHIDINITRNGERVVLEYKDDGNGLPPDGNDVLFKPGWYEPNSVRKNTLGSHITYSLVTNTLKGSIKVNEELETGLGFIIEFPVEV